MLRILNLLLLHYFQKQHVTSNHHIMNEICGNIVKEERRKHGFTTCGLHHKQHPLNLKKLLIPLPLLPPY